MWSHLHGPRQLHQNVDMTEEVSLTGKIFGINQGEDY